MKDISEFKDRYKGQDIYVVASGASMNYVDPAFFEGKTCVGVNEVYIKFKNLQFYVGKEQETLDGAIAAGIHEHAALIKSRFDCGGSNKDVTLQQLPGGVYYFNHFYNMHTIIKIPTAPDSLMVSWSTITSAIHFAYHLGAKNIIICGHDCGSIDGKANFDGYLPSGWIAPPDAGPHGSTYYVFEPQTIALATWLRERGVAVHSLNPFINLGLEGHIYAR